MYQMFPTSQVLAYNQQISIKRHIKPAPTSTNLPMLQFK